MKIRLDGTRDEIREALDDLRAVLDVSSVSEFYPDRGSKTAGRVYLEAGRRSADGDLRGRFDPDTVEALQGIQDNVYTARGWQCMPAGNEWLRGLLEMCAGILDAGLLDDITRDDLDQLTAENFHAVRHAAEMLLTVSPYRLPPIEDATAALLAADNHIDRADIVTRLEERGGKTAGSVPETLRKIIREFDPADRFKYQLLSRLQTDCDYFLGYGHRNPGALWAGNVPDHIAGMRALWESFPEDARPEWLTADDLDRYERDMMDGAEE